MENQTRGATPPRPSRKRPPLPVTASVVLRLFVSPLEEAFPGCSIPFQTGRRMKLVVSLTKTKATFLHFIHIYPKHVHYTDTTAPTCFNSFLATIDVPFLPVMIVLDRG